MATLASLKEKRSARILSFQDDRIASKLLSMGILPGSMIQVVRKLPGRGAIYLKANGYGIALRNHEAASVLLEEQS
ncbi:FeoA family protein [Mangrovivirga sp. M17]|uniref:Ferrous iron transport protein A n=2 Tax=Mangrovivirga TaxID=2858886 RepID=A0A4D7JUY7_9BACT|nr:MULTISPECIES: FeoA family protein [Mangrovivirga]MCX2745713.1 FeoA family protein [Mangrovivirga halotolerans]QCK15996.1 ferrous iron transport protein A [Mangrovivirga cuniculi]